MKFTRGKKKMKGKIIIMIATILVGVLFIFYFIETNGSKQQSKLDITNYKMGMANPSAVYCGKLGYKSRIEKTLEGEIGFCKFPDGSECRSWAFYSGECGQEWSYCTKQGYDIEIRSDGLDPYSPKSYVVCIDKTDKREIGTIAELTNLI